MVPIKGDWTPFADFEDQLDHYRKWGLVSEKAKQLRPVMVTDGYFGIPEPCKVVGYQTDTWAVIELSNGYHAIYGEYLAELQPDAYQKLPRGTCFTECLSEYIVVDIETTGFDFQNDRIIEVAAIKYKYGKKSSEFHSLVNPGRAIPEDITSLTGIAQSDVDSAPYIDDIAHEFLCFIADFPIVGHNALTFDIPFLSAQMKTEFTNVVIDTLPMARKVFDILPRHKLEYLNEVLQLQGSVSHRALHDVEATNALMWACMAPRRYETKVWRARLDNLTCKPATQQRKKAVSHARLNGPFEKVDIKAITPSCDSIDQYNPLYGKNIVFTGELSIPREKAMQLAVDCGAILKTGVSGKTSYLVVGQQDKSIVGADGMSSKEEKAHELNKSGKAHINIITEQEFICLAKKEGAVV